MKLRLRVMFALLAVAVVAGAVAQPLQASLWYPGQVTIWEDSDWEAIYREGANGLERVPVSSTTTLNDLAVGDVFVGMWQVQKVGPATDPNPPTITPEPFSAVFVFEIAGFGPNGLINYQPTAVANWNFFGLSSSISDPGTMAALYRDWDGSVVPDPVGSTSINDALATAADGTLLWEVGLTGQPGEFWTATFFQLPNQFFVLFGAALNVTAQWAGPELAPHDWLGFGVETQIQLAGTADAKASGRWFDVGTDTDIFLKPVPEPTTGAVFLGLGAVAFGLSVLRRRRR